MFLFEVWGFGEIYKSPRTNLPTYNSPSKVSRSLKEEGCSNGSPWDGILEFVRIGGEVGTDAGAGGGAAFHDGGAGLVYTAVSMVR